MCGIFGYLGDQDNAPQMTIKGLKQLEYRGYDSWGIAFEARNKLIVRKEVGKIGSAKIAKSIKSTWSMGHTRWATHGGVSKKNAHPHLDCSGHVAIVHNGIVENFQHLKENMRGHAFVSDTDSEIIAHLIEDELRHVDFLSAVKKTFHKLKGLNAIIAFSLKDRQMVIVKKGSPVVIGKNKTGLYVASDVVALAEHVSKVYHLEDEDCILFAKNTLQLTKVAKNNNLKISYRPVSFSNDVLSKSNFKSYLEKEILEQANTLALLIQNNFSQIKNLAKIIKDNPIVMVGCGSAYNSALFAKYLFARRLSKIIEVYVGSEFGNFINTQSKKATTIFLSQSGETIDIVEHAQALKNHHSPVYAILNREGSTLDRISDMAIHLSAGPEQSVLASKSFTAKVLCMVALAAVIENKKDIFDKNFDICLDELNKMLTAGYISQFISPVAKKLMKKPNGFIIGKGKSYPLALESSLKIKEVTYLHYEGLAAGELKHGSIALIESGVPCIVYAPKDESYEQLISNAIELKSRGANIIGVSSHNHSVFDQYIPIPDTGDFTAIFQAVVGQLLALSMAELMGNDPDKPRNLAKSVTVR